MGFDAPTSIPSRMPPQYLKRAAMELEPVVEREVRQKRLHSSASSQVAVQPSVPDMRRWPAVYVHGPVITTGFSPLYPMRAANPPYLGPPSGLATPAGSTSALSTAIVTGMGHQRC